MSTKNGPRVVILGGGFAGEQALRKLSRTTAQVTLVDQHPYNTFQPLLYQVATAAVNPGDITYPIRRLCAKHGAGYRCATVSRIDHATRLVITEAGPPIPYDYLIIAVGTTTNYLGIPGAAEHAMTMYTRSDALRVRDRLLGGLEDIAAHSWRGGSHQLNIIVAGGGATGVEMAGAIAEMKQAMITRLFPELSTTAIKVTLVELGDSLLAPFDERLQRYAHRQLIKRGVEVRLNTEITAIQHDRVELGNHASVSADLVVWAAGMTGHQRVGAWDLPLSSNRRIIVDDDLRVQGCDRVFAVGDAAITPDHPLAQLAQPAMQMGGHAARQITRLHHDEATKPFRYRNKGTLATIGSRAAIVQLPFGLKITGLIAWMIWVVLHLWFLLGSRNRVTTFVNLMYRYVLWPRVTPAIVGELRRSEGGTDSRNGARREVDTEGAQRRVA